MLREKIYFLIMSIGLIAWLVLRKNTGRNSIYLGIYLIINFPIELYALYLLTHGIKNYYVYHFQLPLEFLFISLYFYNEVSLSYRRLIGIGIVFCLVSCILNTIFLQPLSQDNSIATIICNILLTGWASINLFEIIKLQEEANIFSLHRFWISIACLVYYPGNMMINVMIPYIFKANPKLADQIWTVQYILGILFYFFITLSFWVAYKKNTAYIVPTYK